MENLIKRLRAGYAYYGPFADAVECDANLAADEIERLERELAECKARFEQAISELSECETQKVKLADQVLRMRKALEHYAEEDERNARHYPPEFAKRVLALDTTPVEEIIAKVKAEALREAADWLDGPYDGFATEHLRRMANELENKE